MPSKTNLLELFAEHEVRPFKAGEVIMAEGAQSGWILVLIEGEVEVLKGGVRIDHVTEPGAVFGEIAALLSIGHSADVRAAADTKLFVIEDPHRFLMEHPEFHLHVSELLARRVNNLVGYLGDVKRQYEGHDHLGMVDRVLESLILRQPRTRKVNPRTPEEP